jgi:hypothetical protein
VVIPSDFRRRLVHEWVQPTVGNLTTVSGILVGGARHVGGSRTEDSVGQVVLSTLPISTLKQAVFVVFLRQ